MSYVRVSILGGIAGTDVWSVNPVFDPTLEFPGGVNQAQLDAAALLIANRSIPANLALSLSTACTRTGARVEVRDDVTDNLIATSQQGSTTAAVGSGTVRMPAQSAIVLSIRTNTTGGSGRGRLYWPAMGATIDASSKFTTPTPANFAADFKAYLLGIRSDLAASFPTIGFDLAVRSTLTKTTPHAVRVQVGSVVDTQRRRRDKIIESYTALAFP